MWILLALRVARHALTDDELTSAEPLSRHSKRPTVVRKLRGVVVLLFEMRGFTYNVAEVISLGTLTAKLSKTSGTDLNQRQNYSGAAAGADAAGSAGACHCLARVSR